MKEAARARADEWAALRCLRGETPPPPWAGPPTSSSTVTSGKPATHDDAQTEPGVPHHRSDRAVPLREKRPRVSLASPSRPAPVFW